MGGPHEVSSPLAAWRRPGDRARGVATAPGLARRRGPWDDHGMTPEFWITTLVVVATPGTGVIYTIAAGLARGGRAGVLAAFACTLGIIPHMLAAITGLAALLYASSVAFEVIKYAGVAYLLYLAWKTWRDRTPLSVEPDPEPRSALRVIAAGIL